MQYLDARSKIKSGDLIAFSHKTPFWKSFHDFKITIVRMFTKSEYSHVGIACVLDGRVFILEAVMPLVRIFPLSNVEEDFYWLPLSAPWKATTREVAFSKIGKPYSQIVAMEAFFTKLPENTVSECAAYALCVLEADGIDLGERATPDAVVRAAQQREGVQMIYVTNESEK